MNHYRYRLTHDCPNCGFKDEIDMWGGARMGSTSWGHDFSCCSDKCGLEFAETHKKLVETKAGRKKLADLWEKLEDQAEHRLCGEPYIGYNAEMLLKSLGR